MAIAEERRKKAVEKGDVLEAVLASIAKGWLVEVRKATKGWINEA